MEWKCRECGCKVPPNFMLWNEVCVFCWFFVHKYHGKKKEDVVIKE